MLAMRNQERVILSDPYIGLSEGTVFQTFAKYAALGPDKKDFVQGIDINFNWPVYKTIMEDMNIIDHYFFVSKSGNVIMNSKLDQKNFNYSVQIARTEFNV